MEVIILKALFDSLVRTFVPIVVGAVLAFFVTRGITLDPDFEVALTTTITAGLSFAWYALVRVFEVYVSPKFGWLLGLAKAPVYQAEAGSESPKHLA